MNTNYCDHCHGTKCECHEKENRKIVLVDKHGEPIKPELVELSGFDVVGIFIGMLAYLYMIYRIIIW